MMDFFSNGAWFVPAAVFGAFLFGAWALLSIWADRDEKPLERLERMAATRSDAPDEPTVMKKNDRVQELLERAAPVLSKPLMPKSEFEHSQLKLRLANAGFRSENAVAIYLGLKFILTVFGAVAGGATYVAGNGWSMFNLMLWCMVAICGGIGFYIPDIAVFFRRKHRHDAIFYTLPDALDLMVVCVEAGLGLDAALRRVAHELRGAASVLTQELEFSNLQLQMGRPRREVLHDLGVRNGVDDLRSLVAVLIQADRFGSSVAQTLRTQSEYMRTRRRQLAEERAQKTAVKLIFPLVLFIFPGIFVVLVGPAAIMISHNLGIATGTG